MPRIQPPVYKLEGSIGGPELLDQLKEAVVILEEKMKATVKVRLHNGNQVFGVKKNQRDIAAEAVIAVAREIKKLKGW